MAINFKFKDWLFKQFPEYFWERDTYKDAQNKGLLQRYLTNFGIEYDDEMINYIHNFMDILTLSITPSKFLPFIGYTLGSPPQLGNDINSQDAQRKFLSHLVAFYKIKGTEKSYILLFNLLGLTCALTLNPKVTPKKFDTLQIYDDSTGTVKFDLPCEPCQEYSINYWAKTDDPTVPDYSSIPLEVVEKLQNIICFVQPIDCKLLQLNHAINYLETLEHTEDNNITITTTKPNAFDASLIFDNSLRMDDGVVVSTNNYTF